MKSKKGRLISLLLAGVLLTGCGSAQAGGGDTASESGSGDEPVYFGVAASITGNMAETGVMMDVAARMAVDEINASGGINGRPIELVLEDTKADPKESTEVARKFVEDDRIMAVLGDVTTSQVMAAAPIYEDGGLVQCTPTASGNDFPAMGEYQFSTAGRAADEIPAFVQNVLIDTLDCQNLAIIYMNNDWGLEIAQSAKAECEKNGIQVVSEENFLEGEKDFTSVLSKIRQTDPDVLFVAAQYTEGALIVNQVKQMGWDVMMTTQGSLVQSSFCALVGDDANIIGQCPIVFCEDIPDAYEFAQRFVEYEGSGGIQPTLRAAATYNAMRMLAQAAENCGDDLNRANLRDQLAAIKDFEALGGTKISFSEEGYVNLQYCVVDIENGQWVPLD
ncbi:MAG: ABC transporter substrate-binding protein [Eubacteriales bacterium]|nr:ABC transporter substrate-binding protein [Eubacteriales bacterium]